jgi:hypothetical protein
MQHLLGFQVEIPLVPLIAEEQRLPAVADEYKSIMSDCKLSHVPAPALFVRQSPKAGLDIDAYQYL